MFKEGNRVSVFFTGQYLDGREFDSNVGGQAVTFLIPDETLIDGWNEGIKLMRDEEDGMLIIPYQEAYGQEGLKDMNGNWIVPPYMTLVFYMSVEAD